MLDMVRRFYGKPKASDNMLLPACSAIIAWALAYTVMPGKGMAPTLFDFMPPAAISIPLYAYLNIKSIRGPDSRIFSIALLLLTSIVVIAAVIFNGTL
ncbi:MAG: hypothetical protein M1564_00455 [Candidatus Marsarchaeota archaeon]|nr:hypothetical protein [Candidatus Marsarchaeota archaeon]MCL5430759.1 hypothetical protein [Candidatus Marsarchaeota archaeon]